MTNPESICCQEYDLTCLLLHSQELIGDFAIFLDLSRAFDSVSSKIVSYIMKHVGLDCSMVSII